MAKFHSDNSFYKNTPTKDFYLNVWEPRTILPSADDVSFTIDAKYNQRIDLLSYDVYGTSELWWALYVRNLNVLNDPIDDFKAGVTIIIPPRNVIK